jgi:hypothetical protein
LKKAHEAQRAAGFPNLKTGLEAQRAAGFPGAKISLERQRAAGYSNLKKAQEAQRAAGFSGLKKAHEAQRAAGFPALMQYIEKQRALGFPKLKECFEARKANDWRDIRERHHAELLRDIKAANDRKLAEDPTFIPTPLPELESRPRLNIAPPARDTPCPEPGCQTMVAGELGLKIHLRNKHGGYSRRTPFKCAESSCKMYYETEKKARDHFRHVHSGEKVTCLICDRVLCNKVYFKRHLLRMHGIESSEADRLIVGIERREKLKIDDIRHPSKHSGGPD